MYERTIKQTVGRTSHKYRKNNALLDAHKEIIQIFELTKYAVGIFYTEIRQLVFFCEENKLRTSNI